jgi:hypothetical protein
MAPDDGGTLAVRLLSFRSGQTMSALCKVVRCALTYARVRPMPRREYWPLRPRAAARFASLTMPRSRTDMRPACLYLRSTIRITVSSESTSVHDETSTARLGVDRGCARIDRQRIHRSLIQCMGSAPTGSSTSRRMTPNARIVANSSARAVR